MGIDAHQDSLSIAVLPEGQERPDPGRKIPNEPGRIRRLFRRLLERREVHATYEAGCTGFVLWRQLTDLGVDCLVAAPSRVPVLPGEHRKTDRLDAERLAIFLRGGQLTAVNIVAELGNARRFASKAAVAAYVGLVPSEHSSGNKIRRGGITRGGSRHLRRLLIEVSQHYSRRAAESQALTERRMAATARVREHARLVERRLLKRYQSLAITKHTNVAKTAIARELVEHLWAAMHPDIGLAR